MNHATAEWRKSSYSGTEVDCVEVAFTADTASVRDTKNRTGGTLTFPETAWRGLTRAL